MPLNEIAGPSGYNSLRANPAANAQETRATPPPSAAVKPAAPTFTASAVVQSRKTEAANQQDTQRSLMLQAQSLTLARQEEVRLQQKLATLRETIVETENRLREMQGAELNPRKH